MVISPEDKVDIDDYESVEEYISAAMDARYTIEASDFEGRRCFYCGTMIPFTEWHETVVTWDVRVEDATDIYHRSYFCSESCKADAMRDEEYLREGSEYGEADVMIRD